VSKQESKFADKLLISLIYSYEAISLQAPHAQRY